MLIKRYIDEGDDQAASQWIDCSSNRLFFKSINLSSTKFLLLFGPIPPHEKCIENDLLLLFPTCQASIFVSPVKIARAERSIQIIGGENHTRR